MDLGVVSDRVGKELRSVGVGVEFGATRLGVVIDIERVIAAASPDPVEEKVVAALLTQLVGMALGAELSVPFDIDVEGEDRVGRQMTLDADLPAGLIHLLHQPAGRCLTVDGRVDGAEDR